MMNKKRTCTTGRIKYALFAPLAAALLLVSNIEAVARTAEKLMAEVIPQQEEKIHQVCEEMPEFPGGITACMQFLAKNVKYPAEAITNQIEGRVIVQIVIEKDGSVTNAKVMKGIHPSLDNEALRVVGLMPKWKPGKVEGKEVRVKYTLPIMFTLQSSGIHGETKQPQATTNEEKEAPLMDENGIYRVCDVMPEFPGGMAACMKFLAENIKYPEDCKKGGIQGRVIAQITIEKDGSISQTKIMRSVHPSLDKEALRVINSMPKWIPGKHEGQNVACRYTFPVLFKLK